MTIFFKLNGFKVVLAKWRLVKNCCIIFTAFHTLRVNYVGWKWIFRMIICAILKE